MSKIEELKEKHEEMTEEYERLEKSEDSTEYDEMLDENKEHWIMNYYGDVLKVIDSIAYELGKQDYYNQRLYELQEEIDELETKINGLIENE